MHWNKISRTFPKPNTRGHSKNHHQFSTTPFHARYQHIIIFFVVRPRRSRFEYYKFAASRHCGVAIVLLGTYYKTSIKTANFHANWRRFNGRQEAGDTTARGLKLEGEGRAEN